MTFTRTTSGLRNSPEFFECDLIVYTEGKNDCNNTFDEKYYSALIKEITGKKSIKIKPVGNNIAAMDYFEKIKMLDTNNSIVIIDKDLINISSPLIEHKNLFITYGYSWENDFWTLELCQSIISNLTINEADLDEVRHSWRVTFKSIAKICSLDAVFQKNGEALIPKRKDSCGLKLSLKKYNFIQPDEFKRHAKKYREKDFKNCPISNEILRIASHQLPCKIVQGHLWEHTAITIISTYYKKTYKRESKKNTTAPIDIIKNIAFSAFISNPLKYISIDCQNHFRTQFSRIGL
ncbi:MAG: DUF4435 domain-containing protein [Methylococcaceae bacterium]